MSLTLPGVSIRAYAVVLVAVWQVGRHQQPTRSGVLSANEARLANAAIPFAPGPVPRVRPYRFHGTPAAREQAVRCLATAAIYEAGDDADGQRAVIQVALNRLRSRAFPKTVCGIVYQGAALPTGCQFSFSCDASIVRRPERTGWEAALERARAALSGSVFRPVGNATHYHADYVTPYWLGALDKTAVVGRHIFYRPHIAVGGGPSMMADAGSRHRNDQDGRSG